MRIGLLTSSPGLIAMTAAGAANRWPTTARRSRSPCPPGKNATDVSRRIGDVATLKEIAS